MSKSLTSGSIFLIASVLLAPPLLAKSTPILDELGAAEREPIKLNAEAPLPADFDDGDIFVRGRFIPEPTPNPTPPADAQRRPN